MQESDKSENPLGEMTKTVFSVQLVLRLSMDNDEIGCIQMSTYLLQAESEQGAREKANRMMPLIEYEYRNRLGRMVRMSCVGIHEIEEIDRVFEEDMIELSAFQFSSATRIGHLVNEPITREDLPLLD